MKDKKILIIIICLFTIVFILLGYYIINNKDNGMFLQEDSKSNNNQVKNTTNINKKKTSKSEQLTMLSNYEEYFTINSIINNYYENVMKKNSDVLDNIINKDTTIVLKNESYKEPSYYSKFIYTKGYNNITYYFVSGNLELYDEIEETLTIEKGICFLILLDEDTKSYNIKKLEMASVFDYAQTFIIKDEYNIQTNKDNKFYLKSISEDQIVSYYINYYKNLMYLDTKEAYSMLENKDMYPNIERFKNDLDILYKKLDTHIISKNISGDDAKKSYIINTYSNSKIIILENSIMNFSISIDF